jgi:hypothetical protein
MEVDMHDKFFTAAEADTKLRKLRDAELNAQKQKSIFALVAGLVLLALIYVSNFAIHRPVV